MTSLFPLEYLNTPVSGIGAQHTPGRYNQAKPGQPPVTYLAMHPHVSMREYRYTTAAPKPNTPDFALAVPPVALFSVNFQLTRVLDLTDHGVRTALAVKPSELTGNWWLDNDGGAAADTQLLSEFVYNTRRFEAIKYASARSANRSDPMDLNCYAVFPDRLGSGSRLTVEPPESGVPHGATYTLP